MFQKFSYATKYKIDLLCLGCENMDRQSNRWFYLWVLHVRYYVLILLTIMNNVFKACALNVKHYVPY